MVPIKTAVILAAGLGSRLKDRTKERPKGFLEIDGTSLIERSIGNLLAKGIEKIIIGTGYLHQHFDNLKVRYPQIVTVRNEEYASTGSMYTLYIAGSLINESFLLLESDLLYDDIALDYVINDSEADVILASGKTESGDEVYIQSSPAGHLQNMSKDKSTLTSISGELVGITKLSPATLRSMMEFSSGQYSNNKKGIHYEDALVGIASQQPIKVKVVEDLVWCEIDDEGHLARALEKILPRITKNQKLKG